MKRFLFFMMLWLCSALVMAQNTILYVSLTGEPSWSGTGPQVPTTLGKAIEKVRANSTIREIRLSLPQSGKAIYKVAGELVLPDQLKLVGGYRYRGEDQVINPAEMTILQGDGSSRVVTVGKNGVLEGVTVTGGKCKGGNGGGVYVKEGGKVVNCIITENTATYKLPRIGELLMEDGSFLSINDFTYDMRDKMKGVIFWVNPDKTAAPGKQGCAVATRAEVNISWAKDGNRISQSGIGFCSMMQQALEDFEGKANCEILKNDPIANAVKVAMQREGYHLPSVGELFRLIAEWALVDETMGKIWDIFRNSGANDAEITKYFGTLSRRNVTWNEVDHFIHSPGIFWSSTLASEDYFWGVIELNGVNGTTSIDKYNMTKRVTGFVLYTINF